MNAYYIPVQQKGAWCQSQQQYFDQRPQQQRQRNARIQQNVSRMQANLEESLGRRESFASLSQQQMTQQSQIFISPCFGQPPPQFAQSQPTIFANDFLSISSRQDFDGFWDCYSKLQAASGFKSTLTNKNDKINSTILALAMIMKNFGQNPEMWKLIKEKALKWLKSQDSSKDCEQEIANCIKNLPKYFFL